MPALVKGNGIKCNPCTYYEKSQIIVNEKDFTTFHEPSAKHTKNLEKWDVDFPNKNKYTALSEDEWQTEIEKYQIDTIHQLKRQNKM